VLDWLIDSRRFYVPRENKSAIAQTFFPAISRGGRTARKHSSFAYTFGYWHKNSDKFVLNHTDIFYQQPFFQFNLD